MISIVVPVYNAEKTIRKTLESLLNQTYKDFEIIAVNDGSTDKTKEILSEYSNCVRVINQENAGVSEARNRGISEALGNYVMFCDSDDTYEPYAIEKLVSNSKNADWVIANIKKTFPDHIEKTDLETCYVDNSKSLEKLIVKITDNYMLNQMVGKLFKKDIIVSNGIKLKKHLTCGEDLDFICRYCQHIRTVSCISDVVYDYLIAVNNTSLSQRVNANAVKMLEENNDAISSLYKTLGIYDKYKSKLAGMHLYNLWSAMNSVNSSKCSYTKSEKKEYINNIINSQTYNYYLKHYGKQVLSKMIYYIMSLKSSGMILFLLNLKKRLK